MTQQNVVPLEQYERLMARYERLIEISQNLNSTLDLGALLRRILDAATELTETDYASILLIDPSSGQLRFEASSNLSRAEMEAIPVPLEGSLAGWVVTHGEPVLVEDARKDRRWFPRVDKTTQLITRSLLAVPMNVQGEAIGVLEVINKHEGKSWTKEDVDTLSTLANQAAIAVQNARLFQQSDFIAEMVHELRTPLAALKASIALLLRPTLPEEMRDEIVRTMHDETERLTNLTNDFLDLARLESGRARLSLAHFEVRDLIEECVELVRPRAAERNITIHIQGTRHTTEADRNKIKQVLLNLLTNAIKYNREGGTITCTVETSAESPQCPVDHLLVSVADTGLGMSEEEQAHIFEKFYRAPSVASDIGGTGLGLAIARCIIQAHECQMGFTSEKGMGTTFYFTLPAVETHTDHDKHLPGSAELAPAKDD